MCRMSLVGTWSWRSRGLSRGLGLGSAFLDRFAVIRVLVFHAGRVFQIDFPLKTSLSYSLNFPTITSYPTHIPVPLSIPFLRLY